MRRWTLCFIVGISTGLFMPQLLDLQACLFIAAIAGVLLWYPMTRAISGAAFALVWFSCFAHWQLNWLPDKYELGDEHIIVVRMNSLNSASKPHFYQADLISVDNQKWRWPRAVRVSWYRADQTFQAGQLVAVRGKIRPVWGMANLHTFDQQAYRYSQHIGYQVSVKQVLQVIDNQPSWRGHLYSQTRLATEAMSQQGLLLALVFADKTGLSQQLKLQVQQMGLAHLLVISGLHIMLVAGACSGLMYMVLRLSAKVTGVCINITPWAVLTAVVAALGYAWLAGFSLPTQRALLMFCVAGLTLFFNRNIKVFDAILFALFCILLVDPLAVLSVSLWLSFSAVLAIFIISRLKRRPAHKGLRWLVYAVQFQVLLWLLILPVQVLYFSGLSALSPLYNLLYVPVMSFIILPACLLSVAALMIAPELGVYLLPWLDTALQLFTRSILSFPAGWYELTQAVKSNLAVGALLFLVFVALWRCQWRLYHRLVMMTAVCISVVIAKPLWQSTAPHWQVVVFDVGQGLSVLLQSQQETLLYDTGFANQSGYSVAKSVILPYLRAQGVEHLNHFVVSHSDNDHAGGSDDIQAAVKIEHLWHSQATSPFRYCTSGVMMSLGDFEGRFYTQQGPHIGRSRNNNSCVLHLTNGDFSLLLAGDIEQRSELALVQSAGSAIRAQVLIAPHHGSKTSSSAAFIEAVSPRWVVYSAGRFNPWGFPAESVKQRYQQAGVAALNTAEQGMIRIQSQDNNWQIQGFRGGLSPYWYHTALLPFVPRG